MNRIDLARQFDYVREAGENLGLRVVAIQTWRGGEKGTSWCCYFVTFVLDIEFKGKSPLPATGVCQEILDYARAHDLIIAEPEAGCLVVSVNADGHAHHIAFCTNATPLTTIAGNTSEDGKSSNGTGVFEHQVARDGKVFVRVPARG